MKRIILAAFLLCVSLIGYTQTNGITYQAVIINPEAQELSGTNQFNTPLANRNICMQFSILDENLEIEYQETISVNTDEFGMVNLIIGTGNQTGGYANTFQNILWSANAKNLKVDINTNGACANFNEISNQPFTFVPFALFALNSENTALIEDNIIAIADLQTELDTTQAGAGLNTDGTYTANTATNYINTATSIVKATEDLDAQTKTNADGIVANITTITNNATAVATAIATVQANVNTLSNATTAGLALKEDAANKSTDVTTDGASDVKFPTVKSVKTYVDNEITANIGTNATALAALQADVNQNEADSDTAETTLQTNINTLSTATTAGLTLKEDAANKSTDVTTDGASDVKFPTVKSVKTYVDTEITATNGTSATALAALQADVDQNETDSDTAEANLQTNINNLTTTVSTNATTASNAIALKEDAANKSTDVTTDGASDVKFPTVKSVKTYVDTEITATNGTSATALAALQADVDQNETDSDTAEANLQTNINNLTTTVSTNATTAANATALKEDTANKSTDVTTDGASDVKFPTVKSVKTYVDTEITATNGTSATALAALQVDVDQNEADSDATEATLQTNINTLTATVTTNATTAANATALKEDAANKSTDVTTDGASDVKFPTVKSVKTYVDAEITATNGTSATALAALQADVNQNEADSDTAETTLQTNINTLSTTTTAGLALKEDAANKSTDVATDGASDVKFPTVKSVKTYVDNEIIATSGTSATALAALQADVNQNEADSDAAETTLQTNINTLTSTVNTNATTAANATALKEDAANKSTNVNTDGASDVKFPTVKSVKTYVDAEITATNGTSATALAALQADVDQNEVDSDTAETTLQTNINTLSTATTAGLALKEDAANKSTDVTTDGASDVKFPTVKSVKTYVDAEITATNGTSATALAALQADVNQNEADSDTAETTLQTNINTLSTTTTAGLALKANIASPTFTGTPLAPTATAGTNTTQLATTAFVSEAFDTVITDGVAAQTLTIGDFVGGGVVFWVDPADNSKGLVCSIEDQINGIQWYNGSYLTTGATGTAVETGASNTNAIIAIQGATETNYAAGIARAYNGGGFTDWFLPSKDELKQMSLNRNTINNSATANGGVNFGGGSQSYWSSTETGSSAWALFFGNGHEQPFNKNTSRNVRAVRAVGFPAISSLTTITAEQAAQNTAIALKEDAANKSTDVTTDGASDVKFPTVKSVKTYVDAVETTLQTNLNTLTSTVNTNATNTTTALNLKANIASPTFTGAPLAPTAAAGTSTTQLATTAFVTNAVSTSGNDFVKLTTNQTIAGVKTFSSNATFNGQKIGKGNATGGENLAVGAGALNGVSTGVRNTAIGNSAMQNYVGTSFDNNTSIGYANLVGLTTGSGNTSVGAESMMALGTGTSNTSIGNQSLINTTGSNNIGVGKSSGAANISGNNNTIIGTAANVGANNLSNATSLGYGAVVTSSNTIQLGADGTYGTTAISNVKTSGTITAGAITYPNTDGAANQVLATDGSGTLAWATPSTTATAYSGILPVANGGTGSASQNFVDLTTNQTVAGNKSFSSDGRFNELTIGRGSGNNATNTAVGRLALANNTSGSENVAIGREALHRNTTGNANTVVGLGAVYYATSSSAITAFGKSALHAEQGSGNTAIGHEAAARGAVSATLTNSTFLGRNATASNGTIDNATAIGSGATVIASNTIQLGNGAVTLVNTSGTINASGFVKSGGTATQFLMADGSVSAGAAAVREVADEFTATASQTSFTLTQPPSANSKVKMYVNGIRISNTAYSWSGTTLTYNAVNNGNYTLSASDRIQFDYYY